MTMIKHWKITIATCLTVAATSAVAVQPAAADLEFTQATVRLSDPDGGPSRTAGAHPDMQAVFKFKTSIQNGLFGPTEGPAESVRSLNLGLPRGMVGNPTVVTQCDNADLIAPQQGFPSCPADSQIGMVHVFTLQNGSPSRYDIGLYNIKPVAGEPARFGFNFNAVVGTIVASVRPGDYGISSGSLRISEAAPIMGVTLDIWGVPADPSHTPERTYNNVAGQPSSLPLRPFLTNPGACTDDPVSFTVTADSWQNPGRQAVVNLPADPDGTPYRFDGCEQLAFAPTLTAQPLSHVADAPTGLDVDVQVPQTDTPTGRTTAHVRRVVLTLPNGMSVSPSSAAGLGACSPAQIGLGTNDAPSCPDSSKLGTVRIDTPLLNDPLQGEIILAKQDDNPFRSLLALYMAIKGPGFYLKLPGRVDPDPITGQLTTTFDNTPQLPFSRLHVAFRGGPRASLATPLTCGTYTSRASITSWATSKPVSIETPMTFDQGCDRPGFAPAVTAGSSNAMAGQGTSFTFGVSREDRTPYLSSIDAALPAGLLANLKDVPRCDPIPANAGSCPAASQIGYTTVLAGPGSTPLGLTGQVYLTGPYKDAPFGLSIVTPTAGQAGPFDLGNVVVRAGIYVDRKAQVTVKSDPLPTIVRGFPLRLRKVDVTIDRAGFMFNPTSCKKQSVFGAIGALGGGSSQQAVPFQVGGCGDLDLDQQLALKFTGKKTTKDGQHPGIQAKVTSKRSGTNLAQVQVKLPLSVALDPNNAEDLCEPSERAALSCPKSSIVGQARVLSVLPDPLVGPVYFVRGTRTSPSGRIIRTLPKLWIPLSGDGVTIDVDADSDVDSIQRLVTTFHGLPDAPFTEFSLTINGGKHGIIVVSGNPGTCARDKVVDAQLTGQNGQVERIAPLATVEGCKPAISQSKAKGRSVTFRLQNIGPGKVTLSGSSIKKTTRTVKGSVASITARMTQKAYRTLQHKHKMSTTVSIRYQPKKGKATTDRQRVTVTR
jgi:hypothetical protein